MRQFFALSLLIALFAFPACSSQNTQPDANDLDGCTPTVDCEYEEEYRISPMGYSLFFFEYVCADDQVKKLIPEAMPDEGCALVLVGEWLDMFEGWCCPGHNVASGWFCHHVDIMTNTAHIKLKTEAGNSPIVGYAGGLTEELGNTSTLTVPYREQRYGFDQTRETWTWQNPPTEFAKMLRMTSCDNCGLPQEIILPLE